MNIALYGGKFDPPHNGHLLLVNTILKNMPKIDQAWFVPTKTHPWKYLYASPDQRFSMLKLLENDKIKVCDVDIKRAKPTITIDTINELKKLYPDDNFYWICGADTIERFDEWDDHEKLVKLMKFIVYPRPGYKYDKIPEGFTILEGKLPEMIISSTYIRECIKKGLPLKDFVPEAVKKYIYNQGLYL